MRLLLTTMLLLFANGSAGDYQTRVAQYEEQYEQQQPSSLLIACCGVWHTAVQEPQTKPEQNSPYNALYDCLYRAYLIATIMGVIGALIGIVVIFLQTRATQEAAKATAKSAKATEDSVNLQKVAQRQWVDTKRFTTTTPYPENPNLLQVSFEVVNPTSAPLRLWLVGITSAGGESNAQGFPKNTLLTPNHPYIFSGAITLTDSQLAKYKSPEALILPLKGFVIYIDALNDSWEQRFSLMLICNGIVAGDVLTTEYTHTLHKVELPETRHTE